MVPTGSLCRNVRSCCRRSHTWNNNFHGPSNCHKLCLRYWLHMCHLLLRGQMGRLWVSSSRLVRSQVRSAKGLEESHSAKRKTAQGDPEWWRADRIQTDSHSPLSSVRSSSRKSRTVSNSRRKRLLDRKEHHRSRGRSVHQAEEVKLESKEKPAVRLERTRSFRCRCGLVGNCPGFGGNRK